jgi:hypothetical protein
MIRGFLVEFISVKTGAEMTGMSTGDHLAIIGLDRG